ncbi:MAG TPA: hypothetical protein VGL56_19570 [Fimbriimonadaceae bacterium]
MSVAYTVQSAIKFDVRAEVMRVKPGFAKVHYKGINLVAPGTPSEPLPDLSSFVGPDGMPQGVSYQGDSALLVMIGLAGITSNSTVGLHDTVAFHWTDQLKLHVDGQGKISQIDAAHKTITVDWKQTWAFTSGTSLDVSLKSVYDLADCRLKSSDGEASLAGQSVFKFNVTSKEG